MKLPVSAKSGLSAPGARAPGLYHEPTAAQVERLIAAVRGEEYKPPEKAPLYQKPTYAQFERLIAAYAPPPARFPGPWPASPCRPSRRSSSSRRRSRRYSRPLAAT